MAKARGIKLRVSKVVDTNKISNHSGIESTICEYILVSTDTNPRSIGIELIIPVSPITTKDHGKMYTPPSFFAVVNLLFNERPHCSRTQSKIV